MRPRIFITWLLVFFWAASLPITSAWASWNSFGRYNAADFYNAHLGLVGINNGKSGLIERVVDTNVTVVFGIAATQIAIQDSNRAWATDGDSLYLGTNGWSNWKTVLGQPFITLVRATPSESATMRGPLFVYSEGNLYRTVGDTMLTMVEGIEDGDSITAMDYLSASRLIAVSIFNDNPLLSSVYLSTDGGASWTPVLTGISNAASVFADTAHHLVFIGGDGVRVSADSGQTWAAVVTPPELNIGALDGQVFGARDCSGTFYITSSIVNGSNYDLLRSQDDGISFESVGASPFTLGSGSTMKCWAFDRGSTVFLMAVDYNYPKGYFDFFVSHDGADGLIPDSVASAITVSADTIYDTMCSEKSVPFTVSVASSICTGIRIDSISVVHSDGNITKGITPQTLFGTGTAFLLSYSGTVPGADSIVLRVLFHSLEWGFKEHVDVGIMAYSISAPALLASTDSLQFGDVLLDTFARRMLQITNAGCSALRVDSVVSSDPAIFSLPSLSFPFNIKGDSTMNIPVTFSPQRIGPSIESIELGTNAGHTFIELEGQGIKALDNVDDANMKQTDFSIFPNPASSMLYARGIDGNASYEIIDLLGRTALSGFMDGQAISVAALPEGIYVLRCDGQTARIIISRK